MRRDRRIEFFFKDNRSAPAIYFTRRVDAIIIGARSAIELISAAKSLDREVYELTQMERAKENAFSRLPRSLVGLLVRTPRCTEQGRMRKIWRKIGRGREGGRESGGTAR